MARSIWTGAIGFGLVHVPVRLFSATEDKTVHFHQLERKTGKRIHYKKVTDSGKAVDDDDIVRGYELSRNRYVTLTDDELDAAEPEKSRVIEIEDFVALEDIDPVYYDKTYYVFPDARTGAEKPFMLLHRAMSDAERVGIGRFVMRDHEYLAAVRPFGKILALETMFFADEVRDAADLGDVPSRVRLQPREIATAHKLVDSLTTEFDPKRYKDTHRQRVMDVIERKAKGEEIVVEPSSEAAATVTDLMAALQASLDRHGAKPPARGRRGSNRSSARSSSRSGSRSRTKRTRKAS
jgi:DNA end-binding protein Ku